MLSHVVKTVDLAMDTSVKTYCGLVCNDVEQRFVIPAELDDHRKWCKECVSAVRDSAADGDERPVGDL